METAKKLTQIFKFLQEYNSLKNPPKMLISDHLWHMWLDELPEHETITYIFREPSMELGVDSILKVRKAKTTHCPEPPGIIKTWLLKGWENALLEPACREFIIEINEQETEIEVKFEDDNNRVQEFQKWLTYRKIWAEKERPAILSLKVYNRLYDLHSKMEKESEKVELLLGDGILKTNGAVLDSIHHPLITKKIRILFKPEIPEFEIEEVFTTNELYTGILRNLKSVSTNVIVEARKDMDENDFHPLDKENTTRFLKSLNEKISTHGQFLDFNETKEDAAEIVIKRKPIMILRNRNAGFELALETILEDLKTRVDFSPALTGILGISVAKEDFSEAPTNKFESINGIDHKILFSKDANEEQLLIAKRIERNGAVLVQGPPGTGKTHTIANLIGHFLAQGQSVLVSSHTSKALSVLQEKIAEPLQSLCVSLLNDSSEQLERSVSGIVEYISSHNSTQLRSEASYLEEERTRVLLDLRKERVHLLNALSNEYRAVVVSGKEYSPAMAGKILNQYKEHSWIPGPVVAGTSLPLSEEGFNELYKTNETIKPGEEIFLRMELPRLEQLIKPEQFNDIVQQIKELKEYSFDDFSQYWCGCIVPRNESKVLEIKDSIFNSFKSIQIVDDWRAVSIVAGMEEGLERKTWETLMDHINDLYDFYVESYETLLEASPELPDSIPNDQLLDVLKQMHNEIYTRGNIGFTKTLFNKEWKLILHEGKVRSLAPKNIADFEALIALATIRVKRSKVKVYWDKLIGQNNGMLFTELGEEPEKVCKKYRTEIENCLNWYNNTWVPIRLHSESIGLQWDVVFYEQLDILSPHAKLSYFHEICHKKLPDIFDIELKRIAYKNNVEKLYNAESYLDQFQGNQLAMDLKKAISDFDTSIYLEKYQKIATISGKINNFTNREKALNKLAEVAPSWCTSIRNRQDVHGQACAPGDIRKAWEWIQIKQELEDRHSVSIEEIQQRIYQLNKKMKEITMKLIEKKAWAVQIDRTDIENRMALIGWKDTIKKIGKRTGVRVPRYIAEAKKLMLKCQESVPVWIMPVSRVVENFVPGMNMFDVVIIDEASQADLLSLPLLYYGKKVIVVGDDKQVTPDSVGMKIEGVDKLIDTYLEGIPNKVLYDEKTSLYHIAGRSFEPICLREHFRCVPPIIQFSNYLAYHGKIKPLRDGSTVRIQPATIAYRVDNAYSADKVNRREALEVASLIAACIEQNEYKNMTFGAISMVGDEQAAIINDLLMRKIPETEYYSRKIQCGNPAQFQGDERDVCFISLVDGPGDGGPLTLRTHDSYDERYGKRFNVAASRAKNQLWVVYSMNIDTDLKPGDIRLRLIQHALNPEAVENRYEELVPQTESEFEKLVLKGLVLNGYNVTPQWKVGGYRIDMVIQNGSNKIALECDGEKDHSGDKLEADLVRQALLERLGWRFIRIRGSQYFKNPEKTMDEVYKKLNDQGIYPVTKTEASSISDTSHELKERVIRRAEAIRKEWDENDEFNTEKTNLSEKDTLSIDVNNEEIKILSKGKVFAEISGKGYQDKNDSMQLTINDLLMPEIINQKNCLGRMNIQDNFTVSTNSSSDIERVLVDLGFEVIDNRLKKGSLWVVGGETLGKVLKPFSSQGLNFNYAPNGGKATGHRAAWYMKEI